MRRRQAGALTFFGYRIDVPFLRQCRRLRSRRRARSNARRVRLSLELIETGRIDRQRVQRCDRAGTKESFDVPPKRTSTRDLRTSLADGV